MSGMRCETRCCRSSRSLHCGCRFVWGTVIIETMFQWPGMGRMAIQAISQRDYPVLMGLTFIAAVLVLFSNLTADILYAVADPRIRHE